MDVNIFYRSKIMAKIQIKTRCRHTKRDIKNISLDPHTQMPQKQNLQRPGQAQFIVLMIYGEYRWFPVSPQMASVKSYLTAVYHGQFHIRCK